MTAHKEKQNDEDRIKEFLKQTLPPVAPAASPARDLWPLVLGRLDSEPATSYTQLRPFTQKLPWFDWALIAGLAVFAIAFPATVPVLLYYL